MRNEIRFISSLMKKASCKGWSSLQEWKRGSHGRNGDRPEEFSREALPVKKLSSWVDPEWRKAMERKIDLAREVIRENELDLKVLFLREQRIGKGKREITAIYGEKKNMEGIR